MKFNIIAYSKDEYISGHTAYNKTTIKNMEYAKIPERVIYGSIRNISKYKPTKVKLNVQSLYRNDNFVIERAGLYPKGKEIGIEITDMILGIISVIIRNAYAVDSNGEILSNNLLGKKRFIYKNRLIIESILENTYYFEMNGLDRLTKRDLFPFWHEFIIRFEQELFLRENK